MNASQKNLMTLEGKTYWLILKTFVSRTKITLIPPLLVGNQLVTAFLIKGNLFNHFLRQQSTAVVNNSYIPTNLPLKTENRLLHLN